MGKLSTFFYVFKKTFTSTAYYGDILRSPFSFSLKFFYFYFFLYALIGSIVAVPKYILPLKKFVNIIPAQIEEIYPPELEVKIQQGELLTNVQEPYYIPFGTIEKAFQDNKTMSETKNELENFLVIDTKAAIEDIYNYKTLCLLTKNYFVYTDPSKKGELKVESLKEIKDLTVNRQLIHDIVLKASPFLDLAQKTMVPGLAFLVFLFLFLFGASGKLFYLLFFSFVVLAIAKILSFSISYVKSYQIGLHLTVILATLFGLVQVLGIGIYIPFLYSLMMIILAFVILKKQKEMTGNIASPTKVTASPPAK